MPSSSSDPEVRRIMLPTVKIRMELKEWFSIENLDRLPIEKNSIITFRILFSSSKLDVITTAFVRYAGRRNNFHILWTVDREDRFDVSFHSRTDVRTIRSLTKMIQRVFEAVTENLDEKT